MSKRALLICLAGCLILTCAGGWNIGAQLIAIRRLNARYESVTTEMTRDEVLRLMGPGGTERSADSRYARWDNLRLLNRDSEINSAVEYSVRTIFLPVKFEFTFDDHQHIVGKHRYD